MIGEHHLPGAVARARHLRRAMTLPEKKLWAALRKLDLNVRRQAPIGRYVADFAVHSARLVVELDSVRHEIGDAPLHDFHRTEWLNSQGYTVLRYANEQALADPASLANEIAAHIRSTKALPLDGGGLGGGAAAEPKENSRLASTCVLARAAAASPPSLTLPPSRGKGE